MSTTRRHPVVILGAGLTGLSTALHLPEAPWIVLEREPRVGGKATSVRRDGYTFDVTGHWLHLRDDRTRALVSDLFAPGDLVEIERNTGVYTHGVMLRYPFQANLHGLPLPVVQACLVGFLEAQVAAARPDASAGPGPRTFAEFSRARFGDGITDHFFVPYNEKLWGVGLERLTPDWVQRFVPLPDVAQVIGGALGIAQEGLGYNARFVYPRKGGIDALPEAMATRLRARGDVRLGTAVERIEPSRRRVHVQGGDAIEYAALVSTLPLPALVQRIPEAPARVVEAASRLRAVPWRWLDVATRTAPPIREHWVYVPERRYPFFRVGVYSNAWAAMAPPGAGALYVELTDREHPPDVPSILVGLAEMGAITDPADVAFVEQRDLPCAYVLFDADHNAATSTVLTWLESVGIRSCGRYGAWTYNSMEDSILAGMEAAAWAQA